MAMFVLAGFLGFEPGKPMSIRSAYAATSVVGLHVSGNHIVNGSGQTVRLLGADRGATSACIQNWGIFSGPTDSTTVQAMAGWGITAVRIPLNEDCWLGINVSGINSAYIGTNYQQAIEAYVGELNQYGIAAILDLHWNAPGTIQAQNQQPMPDKDHAPAFWTSVANAFKGNSSVVFDLYNEPYPDNNNDSTAAWQCWLNGCTQSYYVDNNGSNVAYTWQAAGMQELVRDVRATGANNLIMATGIGWGGILDQWLTYAPSDPGNNLAAGIHVYPGSWCHAQTCWQSQIGTVAQQYPVVVGEFGESDCASSFVVPLMTYLDGVGASYLAWHWWPESQVGCGNYPLLASDYSGTPSTGYGQAVQAHLQGLAGVPTPTPVPPTATVDPTSGLQYDFEGGNMQGWHAVSGQSTLAASTALAYHGTGSLAWIEPSSGSDWTPAVSSLVTSGLAAGVKVTAHVYAPSGTSGLSWSFMAGTATDQVWGPANALSPGTWTTVSWTIPAGIGTVTYLGGQVNNPNGCGGCTVNVDAITWPTSVTSIVAPVSPTGTPIPPTSTPVPPTATSTASGMGSATINSAGVNPVGVAPGTATILSTTVTANQTVSGAIIDFEVYDSSGAKVYQTYQSANLAANTPQTISAGWAVPSGQGAGSYTLKIGVFGAGWTPMYTWDDNGATITVSAVAATSTPTNTPIPPTSTPTATPVPPTATPIPPTATPTSGNGLVLGNFENTTEGYSGNKDITGTSPSSYAPAVAMGNYALLISYKIPAVWSEVQLSKAVNVNLSAYHSLSVVVDPMTPAAAGAGIKVRFLVQGSSNGWYASSYQTVPSNQKTTVSWNLGSIPRAPLKQLYVCWQYTTPATGTSNQLYLDALMAS